MVYGSYQSNRGTFNETLQITKHQLASGRFRLLPHCDRQLLLTMHHQLARRLRLHTIDNDNISPRSRVKRRYDKNWHGQMEHARRQRS
jgi:hypothetical protein